MSRQWTARKSTSVIETAINPTGYNAAYPLFRAGFGPAAARTLAFRVLLAYTLLALPLHCGVYWLTAWSFGLGAFTVVGVSVLMGAFAVAKWLGLDDLLQKLPLLLVLVVVGVALLYLGSTSRTPSANGGLDFFGTTLIVIAAVSILGNLFQPLRSAYSTLTLKTSARDLGIAAVGLYSSLALACLGQNLTPGLCILAACLFLGWFASLVVFEYAVWLQANPDRSPTPVRGWNAPRTLANRRGAVLFGGLTAGLGFGLGVLSLKSHAGSSAGDSAFIAGWSAAIFFGGVFLIHFVLDTLRPDFSRAVFRIAGDALVVFLSCPDTNHPLAHRLVTWWLRPRAVRLVLTGLVLSATSTMLLTHTKLPSVTKDAAEKTGSATPQIPAAPPHLPPGGDAPFERHLGRGLDPHERFHVVPPVTPQPSFGRTNQPDAAPAESKNSSPILTDILAGIVALAIAPPLFLYALVVLVGVYALPRYHARYESPHRPEEREPEGVVQNDEDDSSSLVSHPRGIRRTLKALNAARPDTPWDAKVERLLNGLHSPHLHIGRAVADRAPWLLHQELLHTHAHLLGGTGTGKTALGLIPLASQLIARADSSVVIIDLKGDRAMFWGAFVEAARANLPFRWFTIEPGCASYAFNPLTQRHEAERTVTARAQSLLTATGLHYGDGYGKGFYQAHSLDVFTEFLRAFRDISSFADFSRYAEEHGSYVATHTDRDEAHHLRMVLRQLAAVAPLNVTGGSEPGVREAVLRDAIDMTDVLTEKQVLYFHLPSMEEELTAKSVARLAMHSLVQAAKIASRKQQTVPVYTIVDEAQQVLGEKSKILLEMARSLGVYFVLAHQSLDQLKTADYDITSTIEACTTFKMYFEASSSAALKDMEEFGGQVRDKTVSWTQPIYPGFDENNDDEFSPGRARSPREFEPATANVGEVLRPILPRQEILATSAHPLQAFVRSRSDKGLTQYAGQWTRIECEFSTTEDEYRLRSRTPIPADHPSCITVEARDDEEPESPEPLANKPLPVDPPSPAVDGALATRLQRARESQPKFPPRPREGD
jgi:hypothetical protein